MIVALKEAALVRATVKIDLLYDTQHGTNDFNVMPKTYIMRRTMRTKDAN